MCVVRFVIWSSFWGSYMKNCDTQWRSQKHLFLQSLNRPWSILWNENMILREKTIRWYWLRWRINVETCCFKRWHYVSNIGGLLLTSKYWNYFVCLTLELSILFLFQFLHTSFLSRNNNKVKWLKLIRGVRQYKYNP